jgi:hypothetical protein
MKFWLASMKTLNCKNPSSNPMKTLNCKNTSSNPLQTACCGIQEPADDSINCSVSRR